MVTKSDSDQREDRHLARSSVSQSTREAKWILLVWFASFVWTLGYCTRFGYQPIDPNQLELVMGMPHWVFWGVVMPWGITMLVSIWFALVCIRDDELGQEPPESGGDC